MKRLDRDLVAELSGPERAPLNAVLLRAFPGRADWERLLLFSLDRTLGHYAAESADLRETALRVVEAAAADDWLVELVEAALAISRNRALHTWAQAFLRPEPATNPAVIGVPDASRTGQGGNDSPSAINVAGDGSAGPATGLAADAAVDQGLDGGAVSKPALAPQGAGVATSIDEGPLVFVSYGHSADDDDRFELFLDDLRAAIVRTTGVSRRRALYVDTGLAVGARWSSELVTALSTGRVLMPFYSVGFFASRGCGREWAYFDERRNAARRGAGAGAGAERTVDAILPVLWDNPANYADRLTTAPFSGVQFSPNGPEFRRYREGGMRRILSRPETFSTDIRVVRDHLADAVADHCRRSPLPPGPTDLTFDAIPPAFGG